MDRKQKVLIIGGVAGGASTAPRLRRLDENAEIIMFERGEYVSFANCGLPYYIGGEIKDGSSLTVQTPQDFIEKFNVDVRIFNEVVAIDPKKKVVSVKDLKTNQTYDETYDKLVLSMGAEPLRPPIPGSDSDKVFTLRNIPDTYKIKSFIETQRPASAVVMGGGFIGVEMAENLYLAGLSVTIVEMGDQLIGPIDYDMACGVHQEIESMGVKLELSNGVKSIQDEGNILHVELNNGSIDADMLIMAIGVRPETTIAKAAGIRLNDRGAIIVDEHMRTSEKDIYAVGDAVEITDSVTGQKGYVPLAGPANKQGRIAADNICGIESVYVGTQGSSVIKVFDMTVASTGVNEKTAKRLGLSYDKVFTYSGNHAGYYPGAVNMTIKTLFEKETGKILGAQIVGYDGVDKRCDVLGTAIRAKMTASDLCNLELCYAPPYNSAKDPVNMVGFVIQNIVTGKVKQIHWHDVDDIPRDGSVLLIDVRTPLEIENGGMDGFKNIPLADLRSRMGELDPSKKVYINCQIGLKSYIAARILTQHGFDAYIIAGGYRLYHSILGKRWEFQPVQTQSLKIETIPGESKTVIVDACGMQCPGPIIKLSAALQEAKDGDTIQISTGDPAFGSDIEGFCRRTGNEFLGMNRSKGITTAMVQKVEKQKDNPVQIQNEGKNIIVFSGDLDKAIASFIIANAAAAMGRKVSMFFTFWGLNILRKPQKVAVKKDLLSRMFSSMMPRGSKKLGLSKMNIAGMGPKMIRKVMADKNIDSLESLIQLAMDNGVELIACSMSMDVMGIDETELIDGVKMAGATAMLANAEESDMSLFI